MSARLGRWAVLAVAAVYFLGPLVAAVAFTLKDGHGGLTLQAYRDIFSTPTVGQISAQAALVHSLEIAAVTILVTIALLLPTQLLLHLRLPRWRGLVEGLTLLPLVFPPVVLVVGVSDVYAYAAPPASAPAGTGESPLFRLLRFVRDDSHPLLLVVLYVALAMPFVYRSLDAGIRSVDVRVLTEASRNLGAGWLATVLRVLVPCLRTSLVNGAFLCFALVMGEYTIASILLYSRTFPVWLVNLPTTSGQVQSAVSVFSLVFVEAVLLVAGLVAARRRTARKA